MTFGGSADAINANASFGFNANQNHTTGILQKKVIYAFPYCNVINHKKIIRFTKYFIIKNLNINTQVGYNQEVNVYGYNGDGVDNIGFDDIPYSINEGYDNDVGSTREGFRTPQNANFPRADETIKLLRFEEPSSR